MKVKFHQIFTPVLCHGIPNERPFQDGDYINFDITVFKDGVHGDNSVMVEYGNVNPDIKKLVLIHILTNPSDQSHSASVV
jgi:methionine aminopeptidase